MAETESKPSSGPTSTPSSTPSSQAANQPPTHRVKKLLETYIGSAGRTLSGPAESALENEVMPYKRMQYKLPPDVELSKTMVDDGHHGDGGDAPPEKIKAMMAAGETGNGPVSERGHQMSDVHPEKLRGNGMVTLSR